MTPRTVTHQAPLSMGVSRQEYWSGLPSPSARDLPNNPGIELVSCGSCIAGGFFTTEPPVKPVCTCECVCDPHINWSSLWPSPYMESCLRKHCTKTQSMKSQLQFSFEGLEKCQRRSNIRAQATLVKILPVGFSDFSRILQPLF